MLILLIALSMGAGAADLYQDQAKQERKRGVGVTAQQKANKDLVPIFKCASKALSSKNDMAIHSTCLERVKAFEKKAGKTFNESRYPRKALKKMIVKLRKRDAELDERDKQLKSSTTSPQVDK